MARSLLKLFPRGRLKDDSDRGVPKAIASESWRLLLAALNFGANDGIDGATVLGMCPEEFPLLLKEEVHADIVAGMSANLISIEVRVRTCPHAVSWTAVC